MRSFVEALLWAASPLLNGSDDGGSGGKLYKFGRARVFFRELDAIQVSHEIIRIG